MPHTPKPCVATAARATAKWADLDLSTTDLTGLSWTQFEVVELGDTYDFGSCSCDRTQLTE